MQSAMARRWRAGLLLAAVLLSSTVGRALFTDGGFENGTLANWTKSTFINPGLSGAQPYTAASIVRNNGGSDWTTIVGAPGGGPLSVAVAQTGGALMVPRFGHHAAVVNYPGGNNPGANANAIKQDTTVQQGDVDPLDGKVHVRLAYAPVLSDGSHAAHQQAWFFLVVRNKSRGNAVLYESFRYANQPGVPWQTSGGYTFTDWQVVDIAPGNADLAVGDVIELEAIASGCSQGGHAGWVYVDAFGSFIPGPSVVATAPALVNPGTPLTYQVTARNQGAGSLGNGVVRFRIPAQTTFVSATDAQNSCSLVAADVVCNIGALAAGATYPIAITVNVAGGASGTIAAGNYGIEGTNEPELLGPLVNTAVTANALVDLGVQVTNGQSGAANGQTLTYTITAQNLSSTPVNGATVTATPAAALTNVAWTCAASGGSSCAASGTGAINDTVNLSANGSAVYTLTGTVSGLSSTLSMPASIAAPGGATDQDLTNNSAADNDVFVPNSAPVVAADAYTVAEDGILTVPSGAGVLANDTDLDADTLTAAVLSGPAHGTLLLAGDGSLVYTPAADYFGTDGFTYRASDGTATSGATTVSLAVTPVNDAPTLDQPTGVSIPWTAGPQTIPLTGISAGGGEADALVVTASSSTPGLVPVPTVTYGGGAAGSVTLAPTPLKQGTSTITVTVSDGSQQTQRTFSVAVTAPPFYLTHIYPATGPAPGGTHVRLFGGGFTLPAPPVAAGSRVSHTVTPTVLINGVPARAVVVESDGVVSAVTPVLPAGAPLDVQLALPGGSGTLVRAYTPYERPEPGDPSTPSEPGAPEPDPTNPMDPTAPTVDSDGDGMPDVWEEFYGLDPHDPADASADRDGDGRTNLAEFGDNSHPEGTQARYFAEGNAQQPFRTWVNFYNPAPIEAAVNLTFFLDDATVVKHLVKSPAHARLTIDTASIPALDGHAFGIRVEADEAVVVNRTITWNERGAGATAERAVDLSQHWYFAEGATHEELQTFLLFVNPSDAPVSAEVEYLVSAQGRPVVRTHVVPAHSRLTVWVNQEGPELADEGFGTVVRASAPIAVERATYIISGAEFRAGETAVGSPVTSVDWYFAEGSSGPFFDAFLLLANPTNQTAEVSVRYLPDHGDVVVRTHVVGPKSRVTVPVDGEGQWDGWTGLGMHVQSTNGVPVVAERAMWWSTDGHAGWEEGHGSAGSVAPAVAYAVGDGVSGGEQGASTYLLLANPGQLTAVVRVTLGFEDGSTPVWADFTVDGGRRRTIDVASELPSASGKRFSARVESLNAQPFVLEQSIYWSLGTPGWKTGVSLPATPLR